jgi:hypothetical protein
MKILISLEESLIVDDIEHRLLLEGHDVVRDEDVGSVKYIRPDVLICSAAQRMHANEARRVSFGKVMLIFVSEEGNRIHQNRKSGPTIPIGRDSVRDVMLACRAKIVDSVCAVN